MVSDTKWTYHLALCGETNIEISQDMKGDAIIQTNKDETHIVGTKITARHGGGEFLFILQIFIYLVSLSYSFKSFL